MGHRDPQVMRLMARDEPDHRDNRLTRDSIIDQLLSVLPSDMPDLRESTDHLDPLDLPCQLVYYYGYKEGKFGLQVSCGVLHSLPFVLKYKSGLTDAR